MSHQPIIEKLGAYAQGYSAVFEKLAINFNINYLLDVFTHSGSEQIVISTQDSVSSVLLEEIEQQDSCLYVIMPLQL